MVAAMLLGDLFGDGALPDVDVTALHYDARAVTPGSVFFCVRGFTADGHRYAPDAVANGAVALVVDHPLDLPVPEVRVKDVRAAMAPAAARFHGDPTAALAMVGITGTNGKTTTSFLTRALLEASGRSTGLIGTVTSWVAGVERPVVRTTPEAIDLQRMFADMRDGGDAAAVMEVSSHALSLGRADAIHWDVAAFTNLTQDHLDFHSDMEDYFLAKRKLLEVAGEQGATLIVNVDDAYGARLAKDFPQAITIGIDGGDVRATQLDAGPTSSDFTLGGVGGIRLTAPLPGRFNILNSLVAIAAARALGADDATIAAALPAAGGVPGRFEPVSAGQDFAVIVDYAHKPDALDNVLRTARELAGEHRLIVVVGAGGDRDRGKRPLMGEAAARHADAVVLTSDNPRSEDPEAILDAIAAGAGPGAVRISDRREAIDHAIAQAASGDVVVIAGKGHETYQEVADGVKLPFDDREVAREALRARLDG
jgi:UDP-N-acetylmuramoyl-L-alanyl-D-glutamate--2,6-diaminopimelate ligase